MQGRADPPAVLRTEALPDGVGGLLDLPGSVERLEVHPEHVLRFEEEFQEF